MENFKSKSGKDRTIIKVSQNCFRVIGEAEYSRISFASAGNINKYEFESGPVLSIGSSIKYKGLELMIDAISIDQTNKNGLHSILIQVS